MRTWPGEQCWWPMLEVQQLAKELGVEGGLRTIAFGVDDDVIWQTVVDCQESGGWLVLHNIHLVTRLSSTRGRLLHLLQVNNELFRTSTLRQRFTGGDL